MLIFVVLCCFLHSLRGAPLAFDASDFARREDPAPLDQPHRTTYSIVYSCLVTIFACVWKSVHRNINGPRDSGWTCFKRKVATMLCALIAPELVLFWALTQHAAAKEIAEEYNREFGTLESIKSSIWAKIVGWFQPPAKETTRRGGGQRWTKTHGFFLQMGGFILYENEYPKDVLFYDRFAELLRNEAIDPPTVTERELQDRSKGDALSKAIILLQTMWFILQCGARAGQRLPLSELEVVTLAFAAVNGAIYAAWWDKPQGVDVAICVPLNNAEPGVQRPSEQREVGDLASPGDGPTVNGVPLLADSYGMDIDALFILPNQYTHGDERTGKKSWQWFRNRARKDKENHSSFVFLVFRLPYRIVTFLLHTLKKLGIADKFRSGREDLRVPIFFAQDDLVSSQHDNDIFSIATIIGMLFGAVHLLAWASKTSSQCDLILWRVSAVILTATPIVSFSLNFTERIGRLREYLDKVLYSLLVLLVPGYVISRFVVVVLALLAISNPPRAGFD